MILPFAKDFRRDSGSVYLGDVQLPINAAGFKSACLHDRNCRCIHVPAECIADLHRRQRLNFLIHFVIPLQGAADLLTSRQQRQQRAVLRPRHELRVAVRLLGCRYFLRGKASLECLLDFIQE